MGKLVKGSIDLTTLGELARAGHGSISKSEKNGKTYINFSLWINDKEDQYGNIGSLSVWDKNTNEKAYIGTVKDSQQTAPAPAPAPAPTQKSDDDLPF